MLEGRNVLYIECTACGHAQAKPEITTRGILGPTFKARCRCSKCGVKGRVALSWVWHRPWPEPEPEPVKT